MSKGTKQGTQLATVEDPRDIVPKIILKYQKDLEQVTCNYQAIFHRVTVKTTPTVTAKKPISTEISIANDYTFGKSQPISENNSALFRRRD